MPNSQNSPEENIDTGEECILFSDIDSELTSLEDDGSPNLTPLSTQYNGIYSPKMRPPRSQTTFSVEGSLSPKLINSSTGNNISLNDVLFKDDHGLASEDGDITDIVDWGSDTKSDSSATTLDIDSKSPLPTILEIDVEVRTPHHNSTPGTENYDSPLSSLTSNGADTESTISSEDFEVDKPICKVISNSSKPLNLKTALDLNNPNTQDRAGFTQLIRCSKQGDLENCRKLLEANADVNLSDNGGWAPLHIACSQKQPQIVELMISYGAHIHARTSSGSTPLHEAASSGCHASVKFLLEAGADINSRNNAGKSPLDLCLTTECVKAMRGRLECISSINIQDDLGRTKLHYMCLNSDLEEVIKLVEAGADVNVQDNNGATPLHIASELGHSELVKYLFDHGALINAANKDGNTPLHLACQAENLNIVGLLISEKADASLKNNSDLTPHLLTSNEVIQEACKKHIIANCNNINGFDILLKPIKSESHIPKKVGRPPKSKAKVNKTISYQTNQNEYKSLHQDQVLASTNTSTPSPMASISRRKRIIPDSLDFAIEPPSKIQQVKSPPLDSPEDPNADTSQTYSTSSDGKISLNKEQKNELRRALGYIPLYSVLIPGQFDKGFMVLDYQLQNFLPVPTKTNYFIDKYPDIFHIPLNNYYKERMWKAMEKIIHANTTPDMPKNNRKGPKDFFKKTHNFLRIEDVLKIVRRDFPLHALVIEFVAYDIHCDPITGNPGPKMPGDDGFPPCNPEDEVKSSIQHPITTSSELNIGYFGTPRHIYQVKKFLQDNPRYNNYPSLPLEEAAYCFITRRPPRG